MSSKVRTALKIIALLVIALPAGLKAQPAPPSPFDKALALAQAQASKSTRIVGGRPMPYQNAPWQVALVISDVADNWNAQFCGGAYLGNGWVITAAHCVEKPVNRFAIVYGTDTLDNTGRRVAVTDKVIAEGYDETRGPPIHDLALLHLEQPLNVDAIPLATPQQMGGVFSGMPLSVTGWGWIDDVGTTSKTLQEALPSLQTPAVCNSSMAPKKISPGMLCAGEREGIDETGPDACYGDSGGPATLRLDGSVRLVGIVSWGPSGTCGQRGKYGVYTRVTDFIPWILGKISPPPPANP